MAYGRAIVAASSQSIVSSKSVQKTKKETLEEQFKRLTGIRDDETVSEFLSLTFRQREREDVGKPIFRLSAKTEHRDVLYQVAAVIRARGPESTLSYLKTGYGEGGPRDILWSDTKTLILNLPTVRLDKREDEIRERTLKNAQIFREQVRALKGPKCHKCKSTNTTMTERQVNSADEGKAVFVKCIDCGFGWRG